MSGTTSQTGSTEKTEQAKQAVATAGERAGEVASEAGQQARNVAHEAKSQIRGVAEHTKQELQDQAQARSQQAAGGLRTLADRLGSLAEGDVESAGPLVSYLQDGQDRVAQLASRLESGPDELLDDLRRFARQKPLVFLASAGVLGFVAGRLVRSGAGGGGSTSQSSTMQPTWADQGMTDDMPGMTGSLGTSAGGLGAPSGTTKPAGGYGDPMGTPMGTGVTTSTPSVPLGEGGGVAP